jgi:hypothetical protein
MAMKWTLSDWANFAQILSLPLAILLWLFTKDHVTTFWRKWRTPIFIGLPCLAAVGAWRWGWLAWLVRPITVTLPVWVWAVALMCIALAISLPWVMRVSLRNDSSRPGNPIGELPSARTSRRGWTEYINDEIFGVRWSWDYFGTRLDARSLTAFCPAISCRHRLDVRPNYPAAISKLTISLSCPRCGFTRDFDWDHDELRKNVLGEVERRLNTGEYLEAPKRLGAQG